MSYTTRDKVLRRMGHPNATDAALIARVDDAILAATTQIESDTGRVFTASTATRTFVPDRAYEIRLPDFTAVTTLKLDDDDDGVYETTVTAYELHRVTDRTDWPYDTIRLLDRSFPVPRRRRYTVQVAGTWGWAAVPAPIDQACALHAARIAQRATAALFGVESFGDAGAASIRNTDPDYRSLIRPYVVPQVW